MQEILIYDEIGPDWLGMVNAKWLREQMPADKEPVTIRINSPGGDVVEGQAIYNILAGRSGGTTIKVDGLSASIASYIMLAGDEIEIAENAMVMIHNAWAFSAGNADSHRNIAAVLDKFDDVLLSGYVARSSGKKNRLDFADAMAKEPWLSASEAVEWGLADRTGQPLKVAACVAPGRYLNAPEQVLNPEAAIKAHQRRQEALKNRLRLLKAKST